MAVSERVRRGDVVEVRGDGPVRLAVVADTHSAPHPATIRLIAAMKPDAILHAGDIGDLRLLELFGKVAPVFAVRGNIDVRAPDLPDVRIVNIGSSDAFRVRMMLVHIGVVGPKLRADVTRRAIAEEASLVVCGHSHIPFVGRDRGVSVFNPGSVGPRRFHLPIVFGTIHVTAETVRFAHVDCETGSAWSPPR